MTTVRLLVCFLFASLAPLPAAIVWEIGEPGITVVTYDKGASDNPFLASNQDIISPTVALTRASMGGIFNFAQNEFFYTQFSSPIGTAWAFAGLNGNPTGGDFRAANFANLTFANWQEALEGPGLRDNIVGTDGVLHLIAEDVYLEIQFNSWGVGAEGDGGALSYIRASGSFIPEPGTVTLLGLGGLSLLRRRRRA